MEVRLELRKIRIKIFTESEEYMKKMRAAFTHKVKGYFWMPRYRAGMWNGESSLITDTGTIPYGLLPDLLRASKKEFPDVDIILDDDVRTLFKGEELDIKFDLSLPPRPYQEESVRYCLKYTKGIIRSATASGKSLVISYIIKNLLDNRPITNVRSAVIIVPSKGLVEQFYGDMIEYGIGDKYIGRIYDKIKRKEEQWARAIVITTWQSLKNNTKRLNDYDVIIGDECHQVKSHELKKLFSKSQARYRFGFTGTLPTDDLDLLNTKSFLGPVLRNYSSGLLSDQGFISKCHVKILNIDYFGGIEAEGYNEVKEETFNNEFRLGLIKDLVDHLDHNILLLVGLHKEGNLLLNLLRRANKRSMFLHGKHDVDTREEWRERMINEKGIALIATYGIFQQGINIPNLKYLILAAPFKSKIRVLQSIGRTLRLHDDKSDGAYVFDICDSVRYLKKHGDKRIMFYDSEGFEIEEMNLKTMEPYDLPTLFSV